MTKQTRRRILSPLHTLLTALAAAAAWCATAADRIAGRLRIMSDACDPARGAADFVELRDALTGEPLGMTKKQFRRYVLALGTEDPQTVAKAARELQERRRSVLASIATTACLCLAVGCTKSNDSRLCVPGQQQECACPGALKGAQSCLADGSGFAECQGCGITPSQDLGSQATFDLAGADFAQPDLQGADFTGSTPPDLVNPAYVGISCGGATCGPVNGVLGCCSNLIGGTACYADTASCPGSYVGVALCDGPEDCPGQVCASTSSVDKNNVVTTDEMRCRPTGSFSNQVTYHKTNNMIDSVTLQTVACHSADDCMGQTGTHPQLGTISFTSCCHYQGDEHHFCTNSSLASSVLICP